MSISAQEARTLTGAKIDAGLSDVFEEIHEAIEAGSTDVTVRELTDAEFARLRDLGYNVEIDNKFTRESTRISWYE